MFEDENRRLPSDNSPAIFPVDGLQRVFLMYELSPDASIPCVEVDVDGTIKNLRREFGK